MTISIFLLFLFILISLIIFLYNYNIKYYLSKNDEFEQNLYNKNKSNINISFIPIGLDKHYLDGELIFGGLSIELLKKDGQKIKILKNTEYYNYKNSTKNNLLKKNGLLCVPAGDNVIRIAPPLIIKEDGIHLGIKIIEKTLIDLKQ